MKPKIGDSVLVPRWEMIKGFAIGEYEVMTQAKGRLGLRESHFHHLSNSKVVTLKGDPVKTLTVQDTFFDTPLADRMQTAKSEIDLLMAHFNK